MSKEMIASEYCHASIRRKAILIGHIRRVLALNSLLQTPKTNHKELQDLKTKMAKDQQELKTLLEQRMRQA